MKIIVFGSTGTVGKQLVKQSLNEGHSVTAFVRKPAKMSITHEKLRCVVGNVLNPASVAAAMPGHDAVMCVLGAGRKGEVRAVGTRNIIDGMQTINNLCDV